MQRLREVPTVYLYRDVVDFRKSINGLVAIVEQEMALSPFADALFVFCNRSRDKIKLVYWDRTGFCLWYKRLEKDKFKWPRRDAREVIQWNEQEFNWLLDGYDVAAMKGHETLNYRAISV